MSREPVYSVQAGLERVGVGESFYTFDNGANLRRERQVRITTTGYIDPTDWGVPAAGSIGDAHWVGSADDALGRLVRMPDNAGWEAFIEAFPTREWLVSTPGKLPKRSWF